LSVVIKGGTTTVMLGGSIGQVEKRVELTPKAAGQTAGAT